MATIDGGEGDDTLVGSGTDDWIRGAGGNDVLSGGTGADTLEGGEGDDTLDGGGPNGDNSDNVLHGGDGNDILTSGLSSRLYGDAGDDQLRGSGFSTLTGGEGHDRFYASSFSPSYISTVTDFQDGDVVDLGQLLAFTDYVAGDPFLQGYVRLVQDGADALLQYDYNGFSRGAGFRSVMRLLGIDASSLTAGAFDGFNPQAVSTTHYAMEPEGGSVTWGPGSLLTHVYGGPGDDTATLNLTGGAAKLSVGVDLTAIELDADGDGRPDLRLEGIERLVLSGPSVTLTGWWLHDSLYAPIQYAGTAGADRFDAAGLNYVYDIQADGLDGDDTLIGTLGADSLAGGQGQDSLDGGRNDDRLSGGGGDDRLFGGAGLDSLDGGQGHDQLNGGEDNDTLDGGTGQDTLTGGPGDDLYRLDSAFDVIVSPFGSGTDRAITSASYSLAVDVVLDRLEAAAGTAALNLTGNAYAQTLVGNAGHNTLDGWAGADTLIGGAGNDTYLTDIAADVVVEQSGEGFDTVKTSAPAYTLPANIEVLTYTGVSAFRGTGNDLSNVITGGSGIDLLDGGAGSDRLIGLGGNDTYIVDGLGDVIVEAVGQGLDTVKTGFSAYQLGANVENLTFTGSGRFQGFGNDLANVITGGAGHDTLDGRGGADRMVGGLGDDVYFVDNVNDIVVEVAGEGADRILTTLNSAKAASAVESLIFIGTGNFQGFAHAQGSKVFGAAGQDMLIGSSGADLLAGMAGNDTLTGNGGSDIFYFDSALTGQGVDRITDFVSGVDHIQLRATGFGVASLADLGFVAGAAPAATDSRPSLLYDTATGGLWFDATGGDTSDQVQIAVLTGRPALTLSDLLVV